MEGLGYSGLRRGARQWGIPASQPSRGRPRFSHRSHRWSARAKERRLARVAQVLSLPARKRRASAEVQPRRRQLAGAGTGHRGQGEDTSPGLSTASARCRGEQDRRDQTHEAEGASFGPTLSLPCRCGTCSATGPFLSLPRTRLLGQDGARGPPPLGQRKVRPAERGFGDGWHRFQSKLAQAPDPVLPGPPSVLDPAKRLADLACPRL